MQVEHESPRAPTSPRGYVVRFGRGGKVCYTPGGSVRFFTTREAAQHFATTRARTEQGIVPEVVELREIGEDVPTDYHLPIAVERTADGFVGECACGSITAPYTSRVNARAALTKYAGVA